MKRLFRIRSAALLGLGLGVQAAYGYDLMNAYRDALGYDAQLSSAKRQLAAAQEKPVQAQSAFKPTVNGTGALGYQLVDTNISAHRNYTTQSYGVGLTYPIYRAANVPALEQGKLSVLLGELQLAQAQQDLMVRTVQAYFDVLIAQENLIAIQAQKKAIAEQLAAAKRNFEVGTATITDQQEAQARADLATSQEIANINDTQAKLETLRLLVGKDVGALDVLNTGIDLVPPLPNQLANWVEQARNSAFGVQSSKLSADIAKREIDKQAAGNRPTLDAVSNLSFARGSSGVALGTNVRTAYAGLSLAVPFYNGGVVDSRVRESIALYEKAMFDNESAKRSSENATRQLFIKLNSSLAQLKALEAAEKSSQLALDSNQLGYQVGVRINIDVLNAQQQLYSTRRDLAKARYEYLIDSIKLKQAVAALSEADMVSVNSLLRAPSSDAGTKK
jgi:outer membrane protein